MILRHGRFRGSAGSLHRFPEVHDVEILGDIPAMVPRTAAVTHGVGAVIGGKTTGVLRCAQTLRM